MLASIRSEFKLQSSRRDRFLFFISCIAENTCSHLYVLANRQIKRCEKDLKQVNFAFGNIFQNLIKSSASGTAGKLAKCPFKAELHFRSTSSSCSWQSSSDSCSSENANGLVNRDILFSSAVKSVKRTCIWSLSF